mmetsp:Transcript_55371/g.103909  ORF Transcript_55371/g.103909 Transcript_55371/m.103909 type:complete len:375 (+) Transcript_55371:62-1186(+)
METSRGKLEEVVFETPDPPQRPASQAANILKAVGQDAIDSSALPVQAAFQSFAEKDGASAGGATRAPKQRRDFQLAPVGFEAPEQRLSRLQAEVSELLRFTEASATKELVADLLGADPGEMSAELKVLEKRLAVLAEGPAGHGSGGKKVRGGYSMPASLISQLDRMASGEATVPKSADGQVTYQINYTPSAASISDGAKIAAMESSIAEIERQIGVLEPSTPFPDLQTAISQLQKRVSLLDAQKLETITKGVEKVVKEVDQVLTKKAQLEGTDHKDLDSKVSQLYDFCHRWSATAASLPLIVSRLQSLQALHLQSASFASRLAALEKQQEELTKLLETTTEAVQDLNVGLKENMAIVRDNMKSLEEKITQAVKN